MITTAEIKEIREFLESSRNPLFLFDDDPDGLCSFLLLKKHYKKGSGVALKASSRLDISHVKYIKNNPDLVIVLDKPILEQEFIDSINCKIIWLDHHPLVERDNVYYYNPLKHDKKDNRPTTYLAYSVVKSNLWIAMLGCIADHYIPDFAHEFMKQYPGLIDRIPDNNDPTELKITGNFGKLIRILSFNLKGDIKDAKSSISVLEKINSPYEILNQETSYGKFLFRKYEKLNKKYIELLKNAENSVEDGKFLIFVYSDIKMAFTRDLSEELVYKHPDKVVIVGRRKENRVIISIRNKKYKIPKKLKNALKKIDGYGGGHDYACGGSINADDFERFIHNFKKQFK